MSDTTAQAQPGYGDPVAWHTADTIRAAWSTAEDIEDALLGDLLLVARLSVEAYAPELPEELVEAGECPVSYRLAHLMQVQNLWNAVEADTGGGMMDDAYPIGPRPLDWIVKQILRPKRGVPVAL